MLPRGQDEPYWENMLSPRDRSETATQTTLTGTVATTNGSNTITGTGTAFTTELLPGDFVVISRKIVRVRRVDTATSFEGSVTWATNASGLTATMPRKIRVVEDRRYTFLRGSLLKLPSGHLLGVGGGEVLREGSSLSGGGFTLSKSPRIAIFDGSNYTQYNLSGMTVPAASAFSVASVSGGTKNMTAQAYTILIAPQRYATTTDGTKISLGFGNPTDPISATVSSSGDKLEITFPAMDTANGQNAWRIYVCRSSSVEQGPWFYLQIVTSTDLGGTGSGTTYAIEWLDGEVEVGELASFDNDPAPDAGFITLTLNGQPTLYSCNGAGGTTPGPFIRPGKANNLESYPVDWKVAMPEDILGVVSGIGRDYVMTARGAYIATVSGNRNSPVAVRPFWQSGFYHSDALIFVQDQLFGWTRSGPRRSADDGADGSEQRFEFAEDMRAIIQDWNYEHVFVAHDPKNEAVLFFHPSPAVNANNDIETDCLAYLLRKQQWSTLLKLTVSGSDIIVSGASGGNSSLDFIANQKTFEFDSGAAAVSWYLASHFINQGSDGVMKSLDGYTVTAQTTSGSIGVFGYASDEDAPDVTQANSASLTGSISMDNSTTCRRHQYEPLGLNELAAFAFKIAGTYSGSGNRNRVDDFTIQGAVHDVGNF